MPTPTNRVALVTGGNRGIGRAIVESLATDGVDVIFTYRSGADEAKQTVEAVAALGRVAEALPLDLARPAGFDQFAGAVRAALERHFRRDGFDILVNNAGYSGESALDTTTEQTIDQVFSTQFKGVYLLTQALATAPEDAAPLLVDNGRVVNVSTCLTEWVAEPFAVYASMKGAIEVLTRYWAVELGRRGISVNTVAPGPTRTDFAGGYLHHDQAQQYMISQTALGRVGEASDIGRVVAALTAADTGWVSGQRIEASGGIHL
jgi:NAD(P)-dependent dehydrogenase (short-subunit alcohol dehydrogenase family)